MQSDNKFGELVYELQFLRGVGESIQQRIGLINSTIAELQLAISTLEGISNEEPGVSMLVPIGGGSYVRAKLDDKEKLIIGIGADIAVEKNISTAKDDFQTRIIELEKVRLSLRQQLEETSLKTEEIQREIQKISKTSGEAEDVRGA